ncbi:hypothetical protein DL546_004938 [Coniochaeta pulveracea]|uniref:Rhodanese domain-containing protein n=1 Tax=Coniochaeta pulveracea TaxID=177199 RepID=A0A420YEP2_9PEZI|nr:hypothetical protein DL546_004938 [Coniochaeta pulveracea]
MTSIANLQRIPPQKLSELILAEVEGKGETDPSFAVIDVRDDDHIGGHIRGSQNIPSRLIDAMMPTLVRQLKDKKTVVFHCALSQQRGPSAALKYVRERERMLPGLGHLKVNETRHGEEGGEGKKEDQEVYVLDRGFVGWQEVYGTDERLTEAYRKELWADGYWG